MLKKVVPSRFGPAPKTLRFVPGGSIRSRFGAQPRPPCVQTNGRLTISLALLTSTPSQASLRRRAAACPSTWPAFSAVKPMPSWVAFSGTKFVAYCGLPPCPVLLSRYARSFTTSREEKGDAKKKGTRVKSYESRQTYDLTRVPLCLLMPSRGGARGLCEPDQGVNCWTPLPVLHRSTPSYTR